MRLHGWFLLVGTGLLAGLLVSCAGTPAARVLPPAETASLTIAQTEPASVAAQTEAVHTTTPRPEPTQPATASPIPSPTEPFSPLPPPIATWTPAPTPSVDELRTEVEQYAPDSVLDVLAQNATASPQEMLSALSAVVQEPVPDADLTFVAVASLPGSLESGAPAVLVSWRWNCPDCPFGQQMLVAWPDAEQGTWSYQMLTRGIWTGSIDDDGVRAVRSDDQDYIAVISNPCAASTQGNCEGLSLYRLADGAWRQVWPTQQPSDWNYSLAQAEFAGDGIDTVTVRNSDWQLDDSKSKLFAQNHGSLHRWFDEVWQREGDRYTLAERQVEPSPYNTLVEFIYALQANDDATPWVVSPETIAKADQLGLRTIDYFTVGCPQPSCEQQGPLDLSHTSQPARVTFVQLDGQYLIDDLLIGSQQATPSQ